MALVTIVGVVAVDITKAMPPGKRLALRLPIAKARDARSALTSEPPTAGVNTWRDLVRSKPLPRGHSRPGLGDTAVLQYTSGTTGTPRVRS